MVLFMALEVKTTQYNNATISYVEIDPSLYEIQLLSQPGGSPKSVENFCKSVSNAEAAINGGLFNILTSQYLSGNGCIDSSNTLRGSFSGNSPCIGMQGNSLLLKWVNNDNEATAVNSKFLLNSAYYCFLRDGKVVEDYEGTDNKNMYEASDTRAMIGQKANGGTIIFAITQYGKMTGEEQGEFLKSLGYNIGFNLDGGGSRCIYCNGKTPVVGSRNVLNAFVAVKKASDPTPPTPTNNEIRLIAKNTPFRVRASVVSGTELAMVPVGSSAKILQFISGFQSDGYQWAKVEYNGITGYSQLDTSNDYLIEKQSSSRKIYLKASKIQFRVRSNPVNGTQLALVPINGTAEILSTQSNFASDGYQWAYVNYNGTKGYAQLDLQNAYNIIE